MSALGEARDQNPELDEIVLETDAGVKIERFTSYSFKNDFLTPADAFRFDFAPGDTRTETVRKLIDDFAVGTEVRLSVNGRIQGVGHIDEIDLRGSKESGLEVEVTGRSKIGYAVDSCIDPGTVFAKEASLEEFVLKVYEPFGFDKVTVDNDIGRERATGKIKSKAPKARSSKHHRRKKPSAGNPLNKFTLDTQLKPYPGEGAHAFASRVCQRHGLWIWCDQQGSLVVSRPDFEQAPIYQLVRKDGDPATNIKHGGLRRSGKDQPSVIFVAAQAGTTPDFMRSQRKLAGLNVATTFDPDAWGLREKYGYVRLVEPEFAPSVLVASKYARPIFLFDNESRTEEQLENFLRRELALRMRHAVVGTYTVAGHIANGAVWNVDTMVAVEDDWSDTHASMWILSRSLTKTRGGGTETQIELLQSGSLEF